MSGVGNLAKVESTVRSVDHPKPSGLKKSIVFKIAEQVAKAWKHSEKTDLIDLVENQGGDVVYVDDWAEEKTRSESLHITAAGKFTIFLPTYTSIARDNFTIAHELGHYVLHFLWPNEGKKSVGREFVAFRSGSRDADEKTEWEANWFAAGFLMPEEEFRTQHKVAKRNYEFLGSYFGVTAKAAYVRASSLGIQGEKN